jgi:anhydro-N-acetylmuramic acid kinase
LAFCRFIENDGHWDLTIRQTETIPNSVKWKQRLVKSVHMSAKELALLHTEYGRLLGMMVKNFIRKHRLAPDFVASHGHTVFHEPDIQFTFQIGSGAEIAAISRKTVICDFRTTDVACGGQGAPLVPIGDHLLFSEYDFCLNLGGFANISFQNDDQRIAFDICPVNIVLNKLSQSLGRGFDKDGLLAASGEIDEHLLRQLNRIEYYSKQPPKSLGAEWLEEKFLPVLNESPAGVHNRLRTIVEHIALQIAHSTRQTGKTKLLITGGGAHNQFLVKQIKEKLPNHQIVIPKANIINFKEALIFAFLGLLRLLRRTNCLKSVTGAGTDNIGGAVYLGIDTDY